MRIAGFEFAQGSRFQTGAVKDAKEVGERLEWLRSQCKGELTPEDVVNDAAKHNSPLHSFFEWSDDKAAHQHRLAQARGLIRAVVAVYVSDDKPAIRTRAYVHIDEGKASHYRELSHAMNRKETREKVLSRAWNELQAWRIRYRDLNEFADLFREVDKQAKALRKHGR